ncbi:hypothetical protein BTURTLESOX_2123 [bacterium endosymbiont of Bathymodiolus sp. 5 South]|nr:hypothetical protein BTURTLESOX_2123 [bacterium endosymbiont of Bathymodiolus sp. 5 South]
MIRSSLNVQKIQSLLMVCVGLRKVRYFTYCQFFSNKKARKSRLFY